MKTKNKYLVICISAFLTALVFVFIIKPYPGEDFRTYQTLGWNLANGNGFSYDREAPYEPAPVRTPGYPLFLALIYKLFGFNNTIVFIVQAAIYAFTALVLYCLGREIVEDNIAFLAGILYALYPVTAYWSGVLYTETFISFLLISCMYFFVRFYKYSKSIDLVLSFILAGFCILTRPVYILFPGVMIFIVCICKIPFKRKALAVTAGLLSVMVVLAPWFYRNYSVYGKFPVLSKGSGAGHLLYISTFEFRRGWNNWDYVNDPLFREQAEELIKKGYVNKNYLDLNFESLMGADKVFYQYAIRNIREHPIIYVKGVAKRVIRLYIGTHNPAFGSTVIVLNIIVSAGVLMCAVLGALILWRVDKKHIEIFLLAMPVMYITGTHMFLLGTSRYTIPVRSFLMVFTAAGLTGLSCYIGKLRTRR